MVNRLPIFSKHFRLWFLILECQEFNRVFGCCYGLFNPNLQVRRSSVRKKNGLFETLSWIPVLPQWPSAESTKTLRDTRQQRANSHILWMKTVLACELQRWKRYKTSDCDELQLCSSWMPHTATSSGSRGLGVIFYWLESIVFHSVDNMRSKQSFVTDAQFLLHNWNCWRRSVFFAFPGSRLNVLHTVAEKRASAKTFQMTVSKFLHSPYLSSTAICNMQVVDWRAAPHCAIMPILFYLTYVLKMVCHSYTALFFHSGQCNLCIRKERCWWYCSKWHLFVTSPI